MIFEYKRVHAIDGIIAHLGKCAQLRLSLILMILERESQNPPILPRRQACVDASQFIVTFVTFGAELQNNALPGRLHLSDNECYVYFTVNSRSAHINAAHQCKH